MSGFLNVIVRGCGLLWTLLITALIGNVIASNVNGPMATINFTMFVAALSWVALLYGIASAIISSLSVAIVLLALDGLAVLFTFIDGIVLAAKLRAPNCGNLRHADLPDNWIGFGSGDTEKRCREIQASTAFMWFLWACFCVALFFTVKEARGGFGGSMRSGRPNMSQV
ncbi:non-classical secretion pathway, nce2 component [Pochonia chlamydosporia 170]|uniref:Non-classical secretion pathway, nce2 component n=1 Tax=Pochonia chlamydosporia 170 TaxID=1380566 RepID=A0A179F8Y1_METCM|nr:non-classical secretion pathway, nce2 component [Pochonia chlamydosporia 170]OAQ61965.1 non-classical secretion pathway, nce2 component [Pochonia chlamydosporia 170]